MKVKACPSRRRVGFLYLDMKITAVTTVIVTIYIAFGFCADCDVELLLENDVLDGAFVGIAVKNIDADSMIFSHNAHLRFTIASNLKLFTSAAALEIFGPNYRFITSFFINGKIDKKGNLEGDLLIAGGGDPLISGRFRKSVTEVLDLWADSIARKGVNNIKGDLVVDNNFFEDDELGPGWSHDDLTYWYACPISALSFNDNCVDLHVYPGEIIGRPCSITLVPKTDYIDTVNGTITVAKGLNNTFDFYRYPGSNKVKFFGGIAIDDIDGVVDYVSVKNPHLYCAEVFRDILEDHGLRIKGKIINVGRENIPPKYRYKNLIRLFDWCSDSLGVVISVINKNSQNFFAEQTLKTMGAELYGEGSFKLSTRLVENWLESIGIGKDDVRYCDGSGLSYINLATPSAIIKLLEYMHTSPYFITYYESLAIPTIDRSVRRRMTGHPLANKMRTKTGSIENTRTFSGYLTTRKDCLVAFSILVNNYSVETSEVDDWIDRVCAYFIDNF